jgi:hypothetical protein
VSFYAPSEPTEDARTAIGPIALPPGRYEAAAWFRPNGAADGELRLTFHPGKAALATVDTRGLTPVSFAFEVPHEVAAPPLWLGAGTLPVAQGLSRLDITPLSIVDSTGRERSPVVTIDPLHGRTGAYLAYLDRGAFDEGGEFWTAGGRDASLLVFPAGASRLTLLVTAGAAGGQATVVLAGRRHEWTLAPGQGEAIDLPLPPASGALPLSVRFTGSFRPADVDPESRDRRLLGLRVGITVE